MAVNTMQLRERAHGNPLGYLPPEALPTMCGILSNGTIVKIELTGKLVDLNKDGRYYLEISDAELK